MICYGDYILGVHEVISKENKLKEKFVMHLKWIFA